MPMRRERAAGGETNDAHIRLVTLEQRSRDQPIRACVLHIVDADDLHQLLIVACWLHRAVVSDCSRLTCTLGYPQSYASLNGEANVVCGGQPGAWQAWLPPP